MQPGDRESSDEKTQAVGRLGGGGEDKGTPRPGLSPQPEQRWTEGPVCPALGRRGCASLVLGPVPVPHRPHGHPRCHPAPQEAPGRAGFFVQSNSGAGPSQQVARAHCGSLGPLRPRRWHRGCAHGRSKAPVTKAAGVAGTSQSHAWPPVSCLLSHGNFRSQSVSQVAPDPEVPTSPAANVQTPEGIKALWRGGRAQ